MFKDSQIVFIAKRSAFSLIELLVVIALVGILAAVAIPIYKDYILRAKISKSIVVMNGYLELSKRYFAANGVFPNATDLGLNIGSTPYDLSNLSVIDGASRIVVNKTCNNQKGEVSVRFQPTTMPELPANTSIFYTLLVGESESGAMITDCFYRSDLTTSSLVGYLPSNCQTGYPNADLTTTLCETPIDPPSI